MLVSPDHTLAAFAEAIDVAFARWDHSHLHLLDFGDAGRFMLGGDEEDEAVGDSSTTPIRSLKLQAGARFTYIYDLGDEWRHDCQVEASDVDPEESYGTVPEKPARINTGASVTTAGQPDFVSADQVVVDPRRTSSGRISLRTQRQASAPAANDMAWCRHAITSANLLAGALHDWHRGIALRTSV